MSEKAKKIPSGLAMEDITGEEEDKLKHDFFMYVDGAFRAQPGGWIIPKTYLHFASSIYNFNYQPSDILINTFPKSGTTWTQEIIWNLTYNPDLDNPMSFVSLDARFPNFEADMFLSATGAPLPNPEGDGMKMFNKYCPDKDPKDGILLQLAATLPPPRMMKSHLPLCFYPSDIEKRCKVFYVLREPRDVTYSMYHYCRLQVLWGYRGNLDDFVDYMVSDRVPFGPYWEHVRIAWEKREDPNICIVYYEDMQKDIEQEVRRIDKFLGTNRTDQQITNIIKHTSFHEMKERSKDNPPTSNDHKYFNQEVAEKEGGFFRKGEVDDWKKRFNEDQLKKLNSWMEKNLKTFGKGFKYQV